MPTYQYRCADCGDERDVVQSFADDALTVCPVCEGRFRKVFSAVGVVFKGSGFYRNDSRASSTASGNGSGNNGSSSESSGESSSKNTESGGTADSKADSSKDGKSESKSETKDSSSKAKQPSAA